MWITSDLNLIYVSRFELLHSQLTKQLRLSARELLPHYTPDVLTESIALGILKLFLLLETVLFYCSQNTLICIWEALCVIWGSNWGRGIFLGSCVTPSSYCFESPTWGSRAGEAAAGITEVLCPALCAGQRSSLSLPCHPAPWDSPYCNRRDEIRSGNDRMLGVSATIYHTWTVRLQITGQVILGNSWVFSDLHSYLFIMDICNKGNHMTISSTELNKSPVYHKVCNPSSKDTVWVFFDWITYIGAISHCGVDKCLHSPSKHYVLQSECTDTSQNSLWILIRHPFAVL